MIKGKAIMIGVETGGTYHTVAYATSHRLSLSAQTGDVSTKDHNDKSVGVEITGMSWELSTDNLVEDNKGLVACGYGRLKELALAGKPLNMQLRYFDAAIGADSLDNNNDWYAIQDNSELLVSGQTIITNLDLNAPNKDNATWSATFTGKGEFDIG